MVNRHVYFDSATLYYRAYYAVPESITSPDGTPSGAVRGFLDMVSTLLTQFSPQDVVFAWDDDWRPAWRVALVPSYKTHRAEDSDGVEIEVVPDTLGPQIDAIRQILDAIGLPRIGQEGHEADDILGSLVHQRPGATSVVTGDRDLFQLVDDETDVQVISIIKGVKNLEVIDDDYLINRFGVSGRQYVDYATLRGDASDGLPGVKGVGEKTASSLIAEFGSLKNLVTAVASGQAVLKPAVKERIVSHADYIEAATQVVRTRIDAKLPKSLALPKKVASPADVDYLIQDWGIERQVTRLLKTLNIR
jgi:5'-3' exonuclease